MSGGKMLLLFTLLALVTAPVPVSSELVHGFAFCSFNCWDFSESTLVGMYEPDVTVIHVLDEDYVPRDFVMAYGGAGVVRMFGMDFDDVIEAPSDPSVYVGELEAYILAPFVVRTAEGHYAKFIIWDTVAGYIEYVYQTDGTRILSDKVPAEAGTWGRIKMLFDD